MMEPYMTGRKVGRALEAGCGTGYFAHVLRHERQWPIVPLDISPEGLRYARQNGVQDPVQADITRLPFRDASFDLLISTDVLVHMERGDAQRAAREFSRVLARGGLLVLRVSAFHLLRSRHSEFVGERHRYTRPQLTGLVTGTGVHVLRCTYVNSLLMPIALAKFRIWEPLLRKPPASGVEMPPRWLNGLLETPLAIESAWVGSGLNLAAGQSLVLIGEKTL
jgi:SAM-dependent methyltransferase